MFHGSYVFTFQSHIQEWKKLAMVAIWAAADYVEAEPSLGPRVPPLTCSRANLPCHHPHIIIYIIVEMKNHVSIICFIFAITEPFFAALAALSFLGHTHNCLQRLYQVTLLQRLYKEGSQFFTGMLYLVLVWCIWHLHNLVNCFNILWNDLTLSVVLFTLCGGNCSQAWKTSLKKLKRCVSAG